MNDMKKFDVKVRLVVISFVKFMKSHGVSLDETIEMVEKAWGHED